MLITERLELISVITGRSSLAHSLDVTAEANDQHIRQLPIKIGYRAIPKE